MGLTTPEVVEYWNCTRRVAYISAMSVSMLAMRPTVTIAYVPRCEATISGWGSVSEMTPRPEQPANLAKSFSNFDLNGAFCMLWIARWNPFSFATTMPPRCVPRCEW